MIARFSIFTVAILWLASASAVLLLAPTGAHADSIGDVVSVVPQANDQRGGATQELSVNDLLEQNDRIVTTGDGSVYIHFIDDTVLTIGANSEVILDNFVFDGDKAKRGDPDHARHAALRHRHLGSRRLSAEDAGRHHRCARHHHRRRLRKRPHDLQHRGGRRRAVSRERGLPRRACRRSTARDQSRRICPRHRGGSVAHVQHHHPLAQHPRAADRPQPGQYARLRQDPRPLPGSSGAAGTWV